MRSTLRIVLVLAIVGIAALTWWRHGPPPAPPEAADEPSASVVVVTATAEPAAPTAAGRQDVSASSTVPVRALRIVDVRGVPVADALVAVADAPPERDVPFADVEVEFADLPRVRSASDGTVAVAGRAPSRYVLARKGDAFGCALLQWNAIDPVPELVLDTDRNLQVRVVGPDGAPRAGVPVQIWMHTAMPHRALWDGAPVRSDAGGLLTVWHAQTPDHWDRGAPVVELEPQVYGVDTERQHVRLADRLPEPVDVPCPAHGWLRIRARLPDGSTSPVGYRWRVTTADVRTVGEPELAPGAHDGELRLGPVALGRRWDVHVDGFESVVVDGPRMDGEETTVEIALAHDARLATLRLQWADGRPVANRRVWLDEDWQHPVTSDEQGCIVFLLPGPGATVQVESEAPRRRGEVVVPERAVGAGWFDLGTVRLREQQLLVAGTVVEAGTGIAVAARLSVEAADCKTVTQTDADGSLEFWTEDPVTREVRVRAWADGYEEADITVACGSSDVRLELEPRPRLVVTVLFDDEVLLDDFDVGGRQPFIARLQRGSMRCAFELRDPAPGAEEQAFRVLRADGEPLPWSVPRSQWERCEGGYRAALDLRGRLVNVVVRPRVHGADSYVRMLFARASDGDGSWTDVALGGRPTLIAPRGVTFDAIALSAYGFPLRARLAAGENVLDLPPPATIAAQVLGWPDGIGGRVELRQLTVQEPLLRELVTANALSENLSDQARPDTVAAYHALRGEAQHVAIGADAHPFVVMRRGRYLVVPCVAYRSSSVPLLDAAVEVDVTTPGQRLDVLLRVDPDVARAALR